MTTGPTGPTLASAAVLGGNLVLSMSDGSAVDAGACDLPGTGYAAARVRCGQLLLYPAGGGRALAAASAPGLAVATVNGQGRLMLVGWDGGVSDAGIVDGNVFAGAAPTGSTGSTGP